MAQIANAIDGKSASGLIDVLVTAAQKHIASDVSSGRLTQAQADTLLAGLKQHITDRVNSTGPPGGPHGHGRHDGLRDSRELPRAQRDRSATSLESGKTLGQIADATSGKSKAGLVAALVAHEQAELILDHASGPVADTVASWFERQAGHRIETARAAIVAIDPHGDGGGDPPAGRATKPPGSLGRLERIGVQLAGIGGGSPPPIPERLPWAGVCWRPRGGRQRRVGLAAGGDCPDGGQLLQRGRRHQRPCPSGRGDRDRRRRGRGDADPRDGSRTAPPHGRPGHR